MNDRGGDDFAGKTVLATGARSGVARAAADMTGSILRRDGASTTA